MMFDQTEKFNKSIIQHGKNNNRIYLMKLAQEDEKNILTVIDELVKSNDYTKIVAKVPDWACERFYNYGYKEECMIPNFYNGKKDVHFISRFLTNERGLTNKNSKHLIESNISIAINKKNNFKITLLPDNYHIRQLGEENILSLVELYKSVFKVYPFPIFDPTYILDTMKDQVRYFGVFSEGILCAASSAEIDITCENAEMTDFARHPDCKAGLNLSFHLVKHMEQEMKKLSIKTLYTIARAKSVGMNTTFARSNYSYAGTLINNTFISEGIEDMNVWYKSID